MATTVTHINGCSVAVLSALLKLCQFLYNAISYSTRLNTGTRTLCYFMCMLIHAIAQADAPASLDSGAARTRS
jgi:hypothetical protein